MHKNRKVMKKALLLCSSHNDLGLIRALRKLGYFIIVTGNRPDMPGQRWCDEFIEADYSNKELILSIAEEKKIDNIVQCCNDFGVYTAAFVAEKLGLPGYDSYETTLLLHNKDKFKILAEENNILTPSAKSFSDFDHAYNYAVNRKLPLIIKPVDCSAGNGISKVEDGKSIPNAIEYAFQKSREGRIVVEQFVTGTQHGFCTFLINKKVVAVCSNDEYSILNPYRVEIDTYPASNYNTVKDILINEIENIAASLNLSDGIFHLQYIYDGVRPYIIEVMRRILGNMYHIPGNMLTNMDWEYWEVRAKCGLSLDGFPQKLSQEGYFAYKTLLAPCNGVFIDIAIPDRYQKNLLDTYMLREKGETIYNHLSEPLGFCFFSFPSFEIMEKILISDYKKYEIITMANN